MNDKKEYKSMLKLLDGVSKVETTANKLGQLGIEADDPQVRDAATKLAGWLRSVPATGQNKTQRLIDMAKVLAAGSNDAMKAHGMAILQLQAYCQKMIASTRPQWQEIALAHGWSPPKAK
jgi:hypothetical protein